jgi:hypothetical protein
MSVLVEDGWIKIRFVESSAVGVFIGTGQQAPDTWHPAYVDVIEQVVKIRPPTTGPTRIWLRVRGTVTEVGTVTL